MNEYKNKYLKYKSKYLKLKIGGEKIEDKYTDSEIEDEYTDSEIEDAKKYLPSDYPSDDLKRILNNSCKESNESDESGESDEKPDNNNLLTIGIGGIASLIMPLLLLL